MKSKTIALIMLLLVITSKGFSQTVLDSTCITKEFSSLEKAQKKPRKSISVELKQPKLSNSKRGLI